MYGLNAQQLMKRLKISAVIGAIIEAVLLGITFWTIATETGFTSESIALFAVPLLSGILFTWEIMAIILNWKKILKGIIAPIPFISFLIEYFKAYIMAAKAIIFALKNNGKDNA